MATKKTPEWQSKVLNNLRECGGANCHALALAIRHGRNEAGLGYVNEYAMLYRWKKQGIIVGTGEKSSVGEVFVPAK